MSELDALAEVQENDSAIDRLVFRIESLPERAELSALNDGLSRLDEQRVALVERRTKAAATQQRHETEAAALEQRIGSLDKQLYSGSVSATRDLQAMAHEVDSLKARRSEIDEAILVAMEEVEEIAGHLDALDEETKRSAASMERLNVVIAEATSTVEAEITAHRSARSAAAESVSPGLMSTYEALRERNGGVGAAKLVSGACSGCHLSLPAVELDKIRHAPAGSVSNCDQCGRILIP